MTPQEEYNQWFCSMIDKHVPRLFARVDKERYEKLSWLEAVVPHDDERRVIYLSSYGCELTPAANGHHCHFDAFEEDDHEEEFLRAIEWIKDFKNDQLFLITEYDGDRVVSTMSTSDKNDLKPDKGRKMTVLTYSDQYEITS